MLFLTNKFRKRSRTLCLTEPCPPTKHVQRNWSEQVIPTTHMESSMVGSVNHMFYINLDRCTERREYMETNVCAHPMFRDVSIHRISATDGSGVGVGSASTDGVGSSSHIIDTYLSFEAPYSKKPDVSNAVYACTISHLRTIEEFAKMDDIEDSEYALIMEDDVSLEFGPYWTTSIQQCIQNAPRDWEILQLSVIPVRAPTAPLPTYDRWSEKKQVYGSAAYLIRHSAAKRLIRFLHRKYHGSQMDSNTNKPYCIGPPMSACHVSDVLIYDYLCTYTVYPPLFTYRDENDSTIHPDHLSLHIRAKDITKQMYIDASTKNVSATSTSVSTSTSTT